MIGSNEMPRELKFRAWDKDSKSFKYLKLEQNHIRLPAMEFENLLEWQQYTGLKDKNGKEIFEGDICRVDHKDSRYKPTNAEIKWSGKSAEWDVGVGTASEVGWSHEVIGNIHENPELLEGKNA